MKSIRIGSATGFYGDTILPAIESVKKGKLDYLCFDSLAELTMAILQKDYERDSNLGYTKDLKPIMKQLIPICYENNVKILTNSGGINPLGAKNVIEDLLEELGIELKVAVVTGDNIKGMLSELEEEQLLVNSQNNTPFDLTNHDAKFANAYIGAEPLVKALQEGADIVISGRTVDAAQFAAPIIYEFDWSWNDWDRLAKAMTIGHLMECSGQAVGGNFSGDWQSLDLINFGFPIAEVSENGEAIMSKTPDSGGLVSKDTLKEQLLYEVHDPYNYLLPDVIVNIADTKLEDVGKDQVKVYGTTGKPPSGKYKALIGYQNGYLGETIFGYSWPDPLKKAEKAAEILQAHMDRDNIQYDDIHISYMGYNSLHGSLHEENQELNEVYLRLAIHTRDKKDAMRLGRLVPPLALSGPPFMAGIGGMRKPRELLGICPILIPREIVDKQIKVEVF